MIHYVLILAGGEGSRLQNTQHPKQFLEINKVPILMHSINAFKETPLRTSSGPKDLCKSSTTMATFLSKLF